MNFASYGPFCIKYLMILLNLILCYQLIQVYYWNSSIFITYRENQMVFPLYLLNQSTFFIKVCVNYQVRRKTRNIH